jgi:SAM-dependent methyltransferase
MDTLRLPVPKQPLLRFAFNWLKRSRAVLRPFAPVLRVLLDLAAKVCLAANKLVGFAYLKLWPILGVYWYDHQFDYLLGPAFNKWTERGTLANRYIQSDDIVLDVACGDGSYSGNYYSQNASQVDAFDYDEKAIATARRKYAKSNINFFVADATQLNLIKKYDVVLFFAAIEHFPAEDGAKLLRKFGAALKPEGILVGSTPIFAEIGGHNDEH